MRFKDFLNEKLGSVTDITSKFSNISKNLKSVKLYPDRDLVLTFIDKDEDKIKKEIKNILPKIKKQVQKYFKILYISDEENWSLVSSSKGKEIGVKIKIKEIE